MASGPGVGALGVEPCANKRGQNSALTGITRRLQAPSPQGVVGAATLRGNCPISGVFARVIGAVLAIQTNATLAELCRPCRGVLLLRVLMGHPRRASPSRKPGAVHRARARRSWRNEACDQVGSRMFRRKYQRRSSTLSSSAPEAINQSNQKSNDSGRRERRNPVPSAPCTGFDALRGVSLEVAAAQTAGLVGKSGSGKTTMARVCLGLLAQTVTFACRFTVLTVVMPCRRASGDPDFWSGQLFRSHPGLKFKPLISLISLVWSE